MTAESVAACFHPTLSNTGFVFANWFVTWWSSANRMTLVRFLLSFGVAAFTIAMLHKTLFHQPPDGLHDGKDPVRFAVAMNATIFVVMGLAVTATATNNWETAILVAGSSLLVGGFIGLLFGVPQKQSTQVVQKPVVPPVEGATMQEAATLQAQADAAQVGKSRDNLVVESAATLGKVLTGFTLAQVGPLYRHFLEISRAISHHLSDGVVPPNAVLAGAILIYFFATGFLSGLFLPNYFMKDYR